jgi:2-polyprenyl-6-methoxyphenol hydroxylase-like FAD-dependent oxidoreductase
VEVTFEHAPARPFDLVIGADGLHSAVRKLTFGNEDQFEEFLGYSVAAFEVTGYPYRDEDIYINYSVPGKQVGRFTLRNDRTLFLFVFAEERGRVTDLHDIAAKKEALRSRFDGLGWECPQILDALDSCTELYFDPVSQIRMKSWSKVRVGLVGDAAFCPSLLAGQGSALAMIAAYVLAGELGTDKNRPEQALQRYEQRLHAFMLGKQDAAKKLAGSFTPRTQWGLFVRNQVTKAFAIPFLLERVMGNSLLDRLELLDYAQGGGDSVL